RYSLLRWIEQYNYDIIDNEMLLAYTGEYFICYYHGEAWSQEQPPADEEIAASLRIDRLTIWYDQDAVEFKAEYTHARGRTSESVYRGVARYNSSTIQLVLKEDKEKKGVENNYAYSLISNNAQANFVHITVSTPLTLPEALKETIKEYTYFPGIVNGMNDSNSAPVSFRMALVKREKLVDDKTWEINRVFAPILHLDNPIMKEIIDYFRIHSESLSIKIDLKN
nr:hypothetical protein [Tanacetum cinerariifolium]